MKYRLSRRHNIQPQQYEAYDFGASVEADSEVDEEYADVSYKEAGRMLSDALDDVLDKEINSALSLLNQVGNTESHLWDAYTDEE